MKKSIFEKGKNVIKAGVLATAIGIGASACTIDPETNEPVIPPTGGEWETDPNVANPVTFLTCNEINQYKNATDSAVVDKYCDVSMEYEKLTDVENPYLDSKDFCLKYIWNNLIAGVTSISLESLKDGLASYATSSRCAQKIKNGENLKALLGYNIESANMCDGYLQNREGRDLIAEQKATCDENFKEQ